LSLTNTINIQEILKKIFKRIPFFDYVLVKNMSSVCIQNDRMLTLNIGGREFPILGDEQTLRSKNPDEEFSFFMCDFA